MEEENKPVSDANAAVEVVDNKINSTMDDLEKFTVFKRIKTKLETMYSKDVYMAFAFNKLLLCLAVILLSYPKLNVNFIWKILSWLITAFTIGDVVMVIALFFKIHKILNTIGFGISALKLILALVVLISSFKKGIWFLIGSIIFILGVACFEISFFILLEIKQKSSKDTNELFTKKEGEVKIEF